MLEATENKKYKYTVSDKQGLDQGNKITSVPKQQISKILVLDIEEDNKKVSITVPEKIYTKAIEGNVMIIFYNR